MSKVANSNGFAVPADNSRTVIRESKEAVAETIENNLRKVIVVHEMVHLLERHHNDRFTELMSKYMPHWKLHREELNRSALGYEEWDY